MITENKKQEMTRSPFDSIQAGRTFEYNGTIWEKRSSRTAHVWGMPHRWFYFSKSDDCRVHKSYIKNNLNVQQ